MRSLIFLAAFLSSLVLGAPREKRQVDAGAQFTSAADELISAYVNPSVLSAVLPKITSAASGAGQNADFTSALLASTIPAWFASAIPTQYSLQFASLEADISQLRSVIAAGAAAATPIPVVITTTDSAGSTYTSSYTSSGVAQTGAIFTTGTDSSGSTFTSQISATSGDFSTFTNSAGSVVTSEISKASSQYTTFTDSVGSSITSLVSDASSKFTTFTDSAGSVVTSLLTVGTNGGSSIISDITSALLGPTSTGGGNVPTGISGAAALGLVGLMIVL